jgi:phosphatidylglycerophosphate synthase
MSRPQATPESAPARKGSDGMLAWPIAFVHETIGLSPNQLSTIGFVVGIAAAGMVAFGALRAGLATMALSQIIDGLDGGVARRYGLQSARGQMLEVIYDRMNELTMVLALAAAGQVTVFMAILAFVAILLVTLIEPMSKFDPGFKRFMLYFGYVATVLFGVHGFQIAMHVIFLANLAGFVIGTILVDYRFQAEIDRQAILRREREFAAGVPRPPDDAPSFLSKLFT